MSNWHYRKCPNCGSMIFAKDDDTKCNKCAKVKHEKAYTKSALLNYVDPDSLTVFYDPLPFYDGGFRKGTTITTLQAECMCALMTFSDGTILIDKNSKKYQVSRDYNGRQRLLPLT